LPSVTSTMDAAREQALKGMAEGTAVIAGEQTGGRGRLKRRWLAPAGNIALSIILYPDIASLPYLIMVASLAVVKAIKSVTGVEGQIKWPNDILIDDKKVCGILIENEIRGNIVAYSIVGIGINVNLKVSDYAEIADTAASLTNAPVKDDLRVKLIKALLTEFDILYAKLPNGKPIYEAWRCKLITLSKKVRAQSDSQIIEGIAEAVDEDGALVIREKGGTMTRVVAGDVTLRK
jgi:BirA family transcriptional regulator, biotin operon repressor / biotin---[acetyl-CoA-carboxylase] ligase